MKKLTFALIALFTLIAGAAHAHGPARLKTDQSVTLNAAPPEVWAVIGSFTDLSWLSDAGTIEATGEVAGNEKGALRIRILGDGTKITEELLKLDEKRMAISTRLTEDNLAYILATNYALHLTIKDEGGKAKVEVKGAFYRAFPQNDPPADQNDEASTKAVEALHQKLIDALVAKFGPAA